MSQKNQADTHLFVYINKKTIKVIFNDIYYLEAYGNYVKLYTKKDLLLTKKTLSFFEEKSVDTNLIRINRSFIINTFYITKVDKNTIVINDEELPIGQTYRAILNKIIKL